MYISNCLFTEHEVQRLYGYEIGYCSRSNPLTVCVSTVLLYNSINHFANIGSAVGDYHEFICCHKIYYYYLLRKSYTNCQSMQYKNMSLTLRSPKRISSMRNISLKKHETENYPNFTNSRFNNTCTFFLSVLHIFCYLFY